jgi:hypothetical protein
MTDFLYQTDGRKFVWNKDFIGIQKKGEGINYKDGLQYIDGKIAPPKKGDSHVFQEKHFGRNKDLKYEDGVALKQLKEEIQYYTQLNITDPHIVVFGADNILRLCGPLTLP